MPVGVIEVETTADRLPVLGYNLSGTGILLALTAVVTVGTPEFGQLLVEAGIMRGGRGDPYKAAVLIREYVYLGRPGFWNGFLNHNPGDEIYLEVRGDEVYTVRLNDFTRLAGD
ncbi:hypothetical protein ES703_36245 [subsurface metagenome]